MVVTSAGLWECRKSDTLTHTDLFRRHGDQAAAKQQWRLLPPRQPLQDYVGFLVPGLLSRARWPLRWPGSSARELRQRLRRHPNWSRHRGTDPRRWCAFQRCQRAGFSGVRVARRAASPQRERGSDGGEACSAIRRRDGGGGGCRSALHPVCTGYDWLDANCDCCRVLAAHRAVLVYYPRVCSLGGHPWRPLLKPCSMGRCCGSIDP